MSDDLKVRVIAAGLTEAAKLCLARMARGEHIGGYQAAALARRRLAEYREHGDVWHGRGLTMRRTYGATDLGRAVARALAEQDGKAGAR